jgi:hypothetical protein
MLDRLLLLLSSLAVGTCLIAIALHAVSAAEVGSALTYPGAPSLLPEYDRLVRYVWTSGSFAVLALAVLVAVGGFGYRRSRSLRGAWAQLSLVAGLIDVGVVTYYLHFGLQLNVPVP